MGTELTLVMVFLDENDKEVNITIKNPKEDLTFEEVTGVMQTIIDNDAILTTAGLSLVSAGNCYYRNVTTVPLTSEDGE